MTTYSEPTGAFRGYGNNRRVAVWRRIVRHLQAISIEFIGIPVAPRKATQEGIGEALGMSRAHVALNLLRLRKDGWVEVRLAHVAGVRRMKKVYCLSPVGRSAASSQPNMSMSWG